MKLFETLLSIKHENLISFHVPGHKRTPLYESYFEKLHNILDVDLTEFPGTDDLFDAQSCIQTSQNILANHLNTVKSYYLVGGTTAGIYAMIMSVTQPGDILLVARDCHRAVYDGLFLGRLHAEYIEPDYYEGIPLGITPKQVLEYVKMYPQAKGLVLTYPNYYGVGTDLKTIRDILDDHNMLLLVDEAHGAHLFLSDDLMPSAVEIGADIVVHSSHKTLPVMTQSSVLHVCSDQVDIVQVEHMLKLHQTSSPSYVLMSSLDIGYEIAFDSGDALMRDLLKNIHCLHEKKPYFLTENVLPDGFYHDPTKMVLLGERADIDPMFFEKVLRKNGIQLEFSNDKVAVFVTSIMNKQRDFEYLLKTMEMLKFKCYSGIETMDYSIKTSCELSINEAFYSKKIQMTFDDICNRISAQYIIPYPPGIPIIVPGEKIIEEKYNTIREMLARGIHFTGLKSVDDMVLVIVDEEEA